jgi:hypothetical protein
VVPVKINPKIGKIVNFFWNNCENLNKYHKVKALDTDEISATRQAGVTKVDIWIKKEAIKV